MYPGSNILAEAMSIIGTQTIQYRQFEGTTKNAQFQKVSKFGDWFDLECSVQRVRRTQYIQFNLEFQRNYVNVFASEDMIDINRDTAGDQFVYNGRLYQLESQGTWFAQDGWAVCMAIDIGVAPVIEVEQDD